MQRCCRMVLFRRSMNFDHPHCTLCVLLCCQVEVSAFVRRSTVDILLTISSFFFSQRIWTDEQQATSHKPQPLTIHEVNGQVSIWFGISNVDTSKHTHLTWIITTVPIEKVPQNVSSFSLFYYYDIAVYRSPSHRCHNNDHKSTSNNHHINNRNYHNVVENMVPPTCQNTPWQWATRMDRSH